jgi:hypothetical protein
MELADCLLKKGEKQKAIDALEDFQRMGIRNAAVADFLEQIR